MTAPRIIHPQVRSVIEQPLTVGESPVWDDETGTLWFVDILAPAVVRLSASGKSLPRVFAGSLAQAARGR